jgi:MFS transporter, MHS family, proline/betaine transporter
MNIFTRKQKEVVGILSIGTFLEYFDFYLYLHFASTLNKLFFGQQDEFSSSLLIAFAYCSSYIFRPIAAILFGAIGDKYGRKNVIRITFTIMGATCLGICTLPTYEQIGVLASVMITLYRALQSISSMGEIVGGEIYLTEYLSGKNIFTALAIMITMCNIACIASLVGIKFSLAGYFNFRYLFIFGITIFALGYFARRSLVESPEFIQVKNSNIKEKQISKTTWLASLLLNCMSPVGLFISLIGMQNILRNTYNYTESMIVDVNLLAIVFCTLYGLIAVMASRSINPYKMAVIRISAAIGLFCIMPALLTWCMCEQLLIIISCLMSLLVCGEFHMNALMYKNIAVTKRFRFSAINFALSRCIVTVLSTIGLVLLTPIFSIFTYSMFGIVFGIAYLWAINHFKKIDSENKNGLLANYK